MLHDISAFAKAVRSKAKDSEDYLDMLEAGGKSEADVEMLGSAKDTMQSILEQSEMQTAKVSKDLAKIKVSIVDLSADITKEVQLRESALDTVNMTR